VSERGAQRLERPRRLGGPEGQGRLGADAGVGGGRELPGEEGDPGIPLGLRGPPEKRCSERHRSERPGGESEGVGAHGVRPGA